jgi:tetratricopeptide (TPR) repeat protein
MIKGHQMKEDITVAVEKNLRRVILLRVSIVLSVALTLSVGGWVRAEKADDLFSEGMKAYENGEFQLSIDKLSKTIPLLKEKRKRVEAFKTMAFAYMAFPKKDEARRQFCNILELDPTFELDPIMTSPKILNVFREAKEKCWPFGGIEVQAISGDQEAISGATVYLNGKLIGHTPLQRKDIVPGKYELTVTKDGFRPFNSRVSIEERVVLGVKSVLITAKIPTITSISHDVTTPLLTGDRIKVTLRGDPGKGATFDLGQVQRNLPMKEVSPGEYVGVYTVNEEDRFSNLAVIGHLEGRFGARASMEARRAIYINTISRSQLFLDRGKAQMENGEYDLAIDSLSKALYDDPNSVEAHIFLAKAYSMKKGAYLESVKYLKKAIELDGDNLEACNLLAQIYIKNGKYEDALPVVDRILGLAPNSGFAYGYMGEILSNKGRLKEAIEAFRESLKLDPGNPRVYFLLGKIFERLDRLADAVLEYETAVELSPTTYQYRDALATVYRTLEQEMSASQQWEKCLELADLTELERRKVKGRLSELRR